jgi:hypothetical protein
MYEFTSNLTSLFCCASFKRNRLNHDAPSDLRTFQPPHSTLSVPLPYNTVPHSSSADQSEDARALHHIFSSSSSVRGYQTAATTPGYVATSRPSLDLDFKFGETSSPPKPQGRLEQIGNAIRQRISESRLSKSSSRHSKQETQDNDLRCTPQAETGDGPVATSQSSTGLTEILASANASHGGYDSDAKSINSPALSSDADTIHVGKGFVKHALEQFEPLVPSQSAKSSSCNANIDSPSSLHTKGHSSPLPESPKKTSFADALRMGGDESPKDLLRRLSAGIAEGSIKMPNTPELRAARLPSIKEVNDDWRLLAPKRSSSLRRAQKELEEKPRQLSDTTSAVGKENGVQHGNDNKRSSLISELDPVLLDYIDKCSEGFSSESLRPGSADQHVPDSPADSDIQPRTNATPPEADRGSVHLFNMRISQRLASRSRIPITSPPSSLHRSTRSLVPSDDRSVQAVSYSSARRPGPVMCEHNRRPSDPQTRALFESTLGSRDPSRSWKTITPAASTTSYAGIQSPSFGHLNDDDAEPKREAGLRRSLVNPHSIAVGGRSLSVNLSIKGRPRHLSPADSGWSQQLSSDNPRSSQDS